MKFCWICHSDETEGKDFIKCCKCKKFYEFACKSCLEKWMTTSGRQQCNMCKTPYKLEVDMQNSLYGMGSTGSHRFEEVSRSYFSGGVSQNDYDVISSEMAYIRPNMIGYPSPRRRGMEMVHRGLQEMSYATALREAVHQVNDNVEERRRATRMIGEIDPDFGRISAEIAAQRIEQNITRGYHLEAEAERVFAEVYGMNGENTQIVTQLELFDAWHAIPFEVQNILLSSYDPMFIRQVVERNNLSENIAVRYVMMRMNHSPVDRLDFMSLYPSLANHFSNQQSRTWNFQRFWFTPSEEVHMFSYSANPLLSDGSFPGMSSTYHPAPSGSEHVVRTKENRKREKRAQKQQRRAESRAMRRQFKNKK